MPQNKTGTGRFPRGVSGNPGGRPRGLSRTVRELVGDDGHAIVEFWLQIMTDETARTSDRLVASRLLSERGWGKAPDEVVEGNTHGERDERIVEVDRKPTHERMRELVRLARELEPRAV